MRPEFEFNGKPWRPTQCHTLFAPYNLQLEQELRRAGSRRPAGSAPPTSSTG